LISGVALADTIIDTTQLSEDRIFPFGKPNTATYGQVITAPTNDTQLDSFTFLMDQPDTVIFRGEVYAWDGEKATGPNLYESEPRTTSGSNSLEEITFNTGGIQLVPGREYVLFATISKDYEASSGQGSWGWVPDDNAYAGGKFVYMNNGSNFDQLFARSWLVFGGDLAFKAAFSDPSESCTIEGTSEGDLLIGSPRDDVICGKGGGDVIRGRGGDDTVRSGGGDDTMRGGGGADTLGGGDGDDVLNTQDGVRGNDLADGGSGRDVCVSDPQDTTISCI
jgi:Ca2+-binding RTX toxin-like protein